MLSSKRLLRFVCALFLCLWAVASRAQAPVGWFTPEVAREIGIETCCGHVPSYTFENQRFGRGRISATTLAHFDTIATFAQGRVVDFETHQSVEGATVQAIYRAAFSTVIETKTVVTDANGIFRLGWVGYSGPKGPKHPRLIMVKAGRYETVEAAVPFGGSAYLHIGLAPSKSK